MNSMTGFGRAEARRKSYKLNLEIASVNSRYLECVFRMPRVLASMENKVKEAINQHISRGKLTITVNLEITHSASEMIDLDAAEAYYKQLTRLKTKLKLSGDVEIGHIASNSELFSRPMESVDEAMIWPDFQKALKKALKELVKMRADEGRNLKQDMQKRCNLALKLVSQIEKQSPKNIAAYKKRLEKRIKELGGGIQLDPTRLAEEVTVYADRSDVTEECIRLRSHVDLFQKALKKNAQAGKRMNFILQEMGRESNTIGSKSVTSNTSEHAIALKEEIEKLREQVQNIE
ncbi:MAG: YicC family protein [candidate division Zixibacteria bacterium]|nr:YicC family protein [candidate division Zixibacteria bacterium]